MKVIIIESGTQAKEVYETDAQQWQEMSSHERQQAEQSRKVFEIDRPNVEFLKLLAGTIHEAELIPGTDKIRIL